MDDLLYNPDHGFFETERGLKLHYQKWVPSSVDSYSNSNGNSNGNSSSDNVHVEPRPRPRGICVFHHGIHGHGGASCKVNGEIYGVACLVKAIVREGGYILYSLDMAGHGFSEGERFVIPNADWKVNRDDLAAFARYVSFSDGDEDGDEDGEEAGNYSTGAPPLFLLGQSYGGCLSIHIARQWMDNPADAPSNFKGICLLAPGELHLYDCFK